MVVLAQVKSTALKRLLLEIATQALEQGKGKIPVLVELRYLQTSVVDRIQKFLVKHDPSLNLDETLLNTLLQQGRFLLLIDGLNELSSEDARQAVARFETDFSQVSMIFTTRELGMGSGPRLEKKLEMLPLTATQMREFVRKYLPKSGDTLLGQLKDRLQEVAETPLLLKMLCKVFALNTQQIPKNKGELFRLFNDNYNKFKSEVAPFVSQDFRRFTPEMLQQLAFRMMQVSSNKSTEFWLTVDRDRAEEWLEDLLKDRVEAPGQKAKEWLDNLLEYHLLQAATAPRQIAFHHQLFQEYYAAEELLAMLQKKHLDLRDDQRLQRFYMNYQKWTESFALMLALLDNSKDAIRMVRLSLDVDCALGARLAGAVKTDFQPEAISLVNRAQIQVRWKFGFFDLPGKIEIPQWLKIRLLIITRSELAIPQLIKALDDYSSEIEREIAAEALGKLGSEKAIPGLLKPPGLFRQPTYAYEFCLPSGWYADRVLDKLGSEKVTPHLLKALEDSDEVIRWRAATALERLGSEEAIPSLLKVLKNPESFVHLNEAKKVLGKLCARANIPDLLKALEGSGSDIPDLLKALEGSGSKSVARRIAKTLEKSGSEKDISGFINALKNSDFYVRRNAAKALGKLGSKEAIPGLLKALKDSDLYVREVAAEALGKLGSEKVIPDLLNALQDSKFSVCWKAAEALRKLGSEKVIPDLLKALKDSKFSVCWKAAEALRKLGSEKVIPDLLKALKDSDSYVRRNAAAALGKLGSEAAISGLLNALEDSDVYVRWEAAEALGKLGSEAAIPFLLNALENSSPYFRGKAAEALGKLGSEAAILGLLSSKEAIIPGLLNDLENSNDNVRQNAAEALGEIGSEAAIPGLLKALEDSSYVVRLDAAYALGQLGSEAAIPLLLKAIEIGHYSRHLGFYKIQDAFRNIKDDRAAHALPHLLTLIPKPCGTDAFHVFTVIQSNCKFYNYDIAR